MTKTYNQATVCPFQQPNDCPESVRLTLDPHITNIMAESRNFDELKHLWVEWHKESGAYMRDDYSDYVELMNKMAVANNIEGIANAGDFWKADFEDEKFEENVDKLWENVKPLYNELHTYMRHKLIEIYGKLYN